MEVDEQNYNQFIEERKILIGSYQSSSQSFDKAILTLASGSFGFTVAFLKELVPNPFPNTKCLIHTSWGLFALSILLILVSFLLSQKACLKEIENTYEVLVNKVVKTKNIWRTVTILFNYLSVLVLVMAFIFWSLFIKYNY